MRGEERGGTIQEEREEKIEKEKQGEERKGEEWFLSKRRGRKR